jgi:hypothetical protein
MIWPRLEATSRAKAGWDEDKDEGVESEIIGGGMRIGDKADGILHKTSPEAADNLPSNLLHEPPADHPR